MWPQTFDGVVDSVLISTLVIIRGLKIVHQLIQVASVSIHLIKPTKQPTTSTQLHSHGNELI